MKSYLRFLGRNKLYTAIEVVGLSIALAFVILLSSYIIDSISYDKDIDDKDGIYVCHFINKASSFNILGSSFEKCPEVEDYCQFTELQLQLSANGNEFEDDVLAVSNNFFEFLPYRLIYGKADKILTDEYKYEERIKMKSYLRFLSRNKLYTAIEVVGLSIALAFVILLSSYIIDIISYDKDIDGKDFIYV